jgi:ribosomal protein S14
LKESADKESVDAGGCNKSGREYTRVGKQQRLVTKKFGFQRKHFRKAKKLAIPGFV